MADLVRTIIEDMLPDLTALGRRKIFTKKEIRQILKAREKAEYIFLRKNVTKKDYLKSINYELELVLPLQNNRTEPINVVGNSKKTKNERT